jgi:hypothetical protein
MNGGRVLRVKTKGDPPIARDPSAPVTSINLAFVITKE